MLYKHVFVSFWIISAILFGLVSIGLRTILSLPDSQRVFSLANVSEAFNQNEQMFLSPAEKVLIESPVFLLVQKNSLQAASPVNVFSPRALGALIGGVAFQDNRKTIIEYIVQPGDNLWSIAKEFEISIETLISANNLKNQLIRPGQELLILPVSGIMHAVKQGENILGLAEKYKVDAKEIIAFNRLSEDGSIFIGQRLIIPGGKMPFARPIITSASTSSQLSTNNFYGQSHAFPFGQCTWWVAQRRAIPAWGHAKSWLSNAAADGYQTCRGRYCIPKKAAVIVVRGNPVFGHVGYVERVRGNQVTFSEMNNLGLGEMNYRTLTIGDPSIIGYIY